MEKLKPSCRLVKQPLLLIVSYLRLQQPQIGFILPVSYSSDILCRWSCLHPHTPCLIKQSLYFQHTEWRKTAKDVSEAVVMAVSANRGTRRSQLQRHQNREIFFFILADSVSDPDAYPDPNPYVFGPHGSGFISHRYGIGSGSGSGSFYHQAKIVRKTLMPTVLGLLYDFLSLKIYVNIPSKRKKQTIWRPLTKIIAGSVSASGSGSESASGIRRWGSADLDPYQNFMDPQHCLPHLGNYRNGPPAYGDCLLADEPTWRPRRSNRRRRPEIARRRSRSQQGNSFVWGWGSRSGFFEHFKNQF